MAKGTRRYEMLLKILEFERNGVPFLRQLPELLEAAMERDRPEHATGVYALPASWAEVLEELDQLLRQHGVYLHSIPFDTALRASTSARISDPQTVAHVGPGPSGGLTRTTYQNVLDHTVVRVTFLGDDMVSFERLDGKPMWNDGPNKGTRKQWDRAVEDGHFRLIQDPDDLWLQTGQGLAEYALILALMLIVAFIILIFLGTQISMILSSIGQNI